MELEAEGQGGKIYTSMIPSRLRFSALICVRTCSKDCLHDIISFRGWWYEWIGFNWGGVDWIELEGRVFWMMVVKSKESKIGAGWEKRAEEGRLRE
jgi:hypothetical protein